MNVFVVSFRSDKRLHPFYKKYLNVAKEVKICFPKTLYKNKSGPVRLEEIPSQLKLSKELLESKNIFADFKRVRNFVGSLI